MLDMHIYKESVTKVRNGHDQMVYNYTNDVNIKIHWFIIAVLCIFVIINMVCYIGLFTLVKSMCNL